MLLLKGKEKSESLKNTYRELRTQYFWDEKKFVAVLFFGKSNPSQVYVNLKNKYAQEIWFDCLIFGQWEVWFEKEYPDLVEFQKKEYSNRIYLLLINNKNREESDNINRNFEKFLNLIDNHRSKNKGLLDILQINNTENLNKVKYIKENSDINDEILRAAESVYSLSNKYNFLYQLWITETTIRLAKISNMDKKDINLLAIIALFNNIWCKNNKDEEDIKENIHNLVKDRIK